MRIAFVNVYGRVTGGADRHCFALAEALRARGHEAEFLATRDDENIETVGEFVPNIVTNVNRDELGAADRARVARQAVWNRSAAAAMRRLVARFKPDVVHAHKLYSQLSVAPLVVANRAGVPVVQTAHDYEFISASAIDETGGRADRDETRFAYRALNTATYPIRRRVHVPRVSSWIAVSNYLAQRYAAHGIECHVLPNFADRPDRSAASWEDRDGILFAGRLVPEKGVADVIDLARRAPRLRVDVVGFGAMKEEVASAAARLPNLNDVGFADRDEVLRRMRAARVVVMPSRWAEPAPIGALEAISTGTPVVAFAEGGLTEMVEGSGAGVAVAPGSDGALAEACASLHDDRDRWIECQLRALAAAEGRFSVSAYLDSIERVYAGAE